MKWMIPILLILCCSSNIFASEQGTVDSTDARNPRMALLLSVVPGLGQVYNHSFLKSGIFLGAFGYYTLQYRDAAYTYDNADPTSANLDGLHRKRNDKAWMMGLVWTLSLLDAYIEAQLWDFDEYDVNEVTASDSLSNTNERTGNDNAGK